MTALITALRAERAKLRRRRLWLMSAGLLAFITVYIIYVCNDMKESALSQGYRMLLMDYTLLNGMLMPLFLASLASRLCDSEHKGSTYKLLFTLQSKGGVYDAKFCIGFSYLFFVVLMQLILILAAGRITGFTGRIPSLDIRLYLMTTLAVNTAVFLIQLLLSLSIENQLIPLSIGLMGGFAGLFSMFLPNTVIQKITIWGYYCTLTSINYTYDETTRVSDFYHVPIDKGAFIFVCILIIVLYAGGKYLFIKREV